MDVEQLHQVLQQSFSPEASARKPAEETIRNLKNLPGSTMMLLRVAAEKQVSFRRSIVMHVAEGERMPFLRFPGVRNMVRRQLD